MTDRTEIADAPCDQAGAPPGLEPTLIADPPPPVARDQMVWVWITAMTVSWFGDALWTVALAWTAAHTLAPALAGVVVGIEMLPQAVLVLLGGVLADRLDTRKVLVTGQLGQVLALVIGASAWQAGLRGAGTLIALSLAFGIASGLTIPAGMTLSRQLVRARDLGTVTGWNQVANRVARLVGAPVGGVLVAWGGLVAAMTVNAVSFLVIAAALIAAVRPRFRLPRATSQRWTSSLRDGLGYLRRDPAARLLVIGLTALNVFVSPVVALGVALRVAGSGWGPGWVGFAEGAFAAGAILGSLAGIRWQPVAPARAGFIALVVQGMALAAIGIPTRVSLLAAMLAVGVTAGAASVWLSGVFQRTIDPSHLGRVSSVTSLGDMSLMPLAVPMFGAIAAASSVLSAAILFGTAMSMLCLWFATRRILASLR
ncbi:MAG: MFS transporter [Nocardioidaceae bacterium]